MKNPLFFSLYLIAFIAGLLVVYVFSVALAPKPHLSVTDQLIDEATITSETSPATSPSPPTAQPASIIFVGDMMFDRHIRMYADRRGSYDGILGTELANLVRTADLVVGNLEGPVTSSPSRSLGSAVGSTNNYIFTFDPAITSFLQKHNMHAVNLGNNHILNFGQDGLRETQELLTEANIGYFGATGEITADASASSAAELAGKRWTTRAINGTTFAFVNYNQFTPGGESLALTDLQAASASADATVLYTHWGNEYVPENTVLQNQARQFFAAGADLIIGSHPHVITGQEDVDGKRVYYSLGNFIFDQYFEPAVRTGLVVKATYHPKEKNFSFEEYRVGMQANGTTELISQ